MNIFSSYRRARTVYRLSRGVNNFLGAPWAGGVVLLVCVVIAMLLANLPWTAHLYHEVLETKLELWISNHDTSVNWLFPSDMTVEKFVNDILMVIFFFTVGLEIKRELVCGQLSSVKRAILPVVAAAGGMLAPALIYLCFNFGTGAMNGWGIPTATDIAFAIGILSILGDRVPVSLKVFLTALAIADDLGAILVIALFYGGQVQFLYLLLAIVIMVFVYLMGRAGEKRMFCYFVPSVLVWVLFYYSGIHSTLSGVAMAMLIPMKPRYNKSGFLRKVRHLYGRIEEMAASDGVFTEEELHESLRHLGQLSTRSAAMSERLEHVLNPYVTFLIMPIFALANAGVEITSAEYLNIFHYTPELGSIGMGVFFGLLLGKPVGIFAASYCAVKCHLAEIPQGGTWKMLFAVACLGGIGFTMSIFVDSLAFPAGNDLIDRGKIAILMGSFAAAVLGCILILLLTAKKKQA